jgi:hypothetical protein
MDSGLPLRGIRNDKVSYKKLCGSMSMSSLSEPFGFGPSESQSRI